MRKLVNVLILLSILAAVGAYAGTRWVDDTMGRDVVLLTSVNDGDQRDLSAYEYEVALEDAEDEGEELTGEERKELIVSIYGSTASLEPVRVLAPDEEALIVPEEDASLALYPQVQADGTYAYQSRSLLYVGGQVAMGAAAAFVVLLALRLTVLRRRES